MKKLKSYFVFLFILFAMIFVFSCNENNSKNGTTSKKEETIKEENNITAPVTKSTSRFEILKDSEKVGESTAKYDKSRSILKIEEETKFNDKIYKKSSFNYNTEIMTIPDMTVNIYTKDGEDSVIIKRDNKNNEYQVTYKKDGQEMTTSFIDTENTYVINSNLFGSYELAFQMIQPIQHSITISSMTPTLNSIFEVKITKTEESKINIGGNILDTIVFDVERADDKQQVWINKENYKIVKIYVPNEDIEVRRLIETQEDMDSIKEINKIAGKRDFKKIEAYYETNKNDSEETPTLDVIEEDDASSGNLISEDSYYDEFKRTYELITNNVTFGYNQYNVIESENFFQVAEQTVFKLTKGPSIIENKYNLSYLWNKNDNKIVSYDASIEMGDKKIQMAVSDEQGDLLVIIDTNEKRTETSIKKSESKDLYFIMPYTIGSLEIMLRDIDYTKKKFPAKINCFSIEESKKTKVEIKSSTLMKTGEVDTSFAQIKLEANVDGLEQYIYLNNEDKSIYKIFIPSENVIIRLSKDDNITIESLSTRDVMRNLYVKPKGTSLGSIKPSDYANYKSFSAEVLIYAKSPFDKAIDFYLDNRLQSFDGVTNDNVVSGVIESNSINNIAFSSDEFPIKKVPDNIKEYLKAGKDDIISIPIDNELINEMAKSLTKKSKTIFEAARSIGEWIYKNIAYKQTNHTVIETFTKKEGDCGAKSQLAIAMLRGIGIPARVVGGLLYGTIYDSKFGQHYWVEVWVGEKGGWIMIDPTTGEFDTISPLHISLWRWENITPNDEAFIDVVSIEKE